MQLAQGPESKQLAEWGLPAVLPPHEVGRASACPPPSSLPPQAVCLLQQGLPRAVLSWTKCARSAQLLHHPTGTEKLPARSDKVGPHHTACFGGPGCACCTFGNTPGLMTSLPCPSRQELVAGRAWCSRQAQPCNIAQTWTLASNSWLFSRTVLLESSRLVNARSPAPPPTRLL